MCWLGCDCVDNIYNIQESQRAITLLLFEENQNHLKNEVRDKVMKVLTDALSHSSLRETNDTLYENFGSIWKSSVDMIAISIDEQTIKTGLEKLLNSDKRQYKCQLKKLLTRMIDESNVQASLSSTVDQYNNRYVQSIYLFVDTIITIKHNCKS